MQSPDSPNVKSPPLPSLLDWATKVLPEDQQPARHHLALLEQLDRVTRGEIDRLMVLMPPGSAKSTYSSIIFPPWWLAHHPQTSVIACSHTYSLAAHFGSQVRELIDEHGEAIGCRLRARRARHDFRLAQGGSYFAVGVQGAVTGRRADLILIDDPIRSYFNANNDKSRNALWDWYKSDLLTRLKPRGRIVIVTTRWHRDDLIGRLLPREQDWHCLTLPAIAEVNDPLGRDEGQPLWPEWENLEELERKRKLIDGPTWSALYQQRPVLRHDSEINIAKVEIIDRVDSACCIRAWDLAGTTTHENKQADWTVGVKLAREPSGRFAILDVVRIQASAYQVEREIARTAERDGRNTIISLPQDPGQSGKRQVQYITSNLVGYNVQSSPETGSKRARARPLASQVEAGNVALLRAPWNAALLDELEAFPNGSHDDQVDALSRAINEMYGLKRQTERKRLNFISR